MSIKKNILSLLVSATVLFAMVLFLTAPKRYAADVLQGVSLWATCVLPATFPFLFLTALLTGLKPFAAFCERASPAAGRLFRVSGAGGGAAILSALSGYPVGARLLFDLKREGRVSDGETFRLACLCTTSGPAFLYGTVGCMMYGSSAMGAVLIVSHLTAVYLVCFVLRFFGTQPPRTLPLRRENPALLYDSLYNAVISILCVGGFIALFSCFSQMLSDLGLFRLLSFGAPLSEGILSGLLEMTTGCAALSSVKTPLSLACSCALVTFGGVCVLCQQAAYLTRAGVKFLPFLGVKALQAALSFVLCFSLSAAFL